MSNAVGSKLHSPLAAEPKRNTANRKMRNIFKMFWQFVKPLLREVVSRLWSSRPAGVTVYNGSLQALSSGLLQVAGDLRLRAADFDRVKSFIPSSDWLPVLSFIITVPELQWLCLHPRTRALVIIIASNNTEEDFGRVCKSNFSSAMTWKLKKSN